MGNRWTKEEKVLLAQLWDSDMTVDEVSECIPDRTTTAIKVCAKRMGLKHTESQTHSILSKASTGEKNGMFGKIGPRNGVVVSDETKEKIRQKILERYRTGSQLPCSGKLNGMYGKPSTMLGKTLPQSAKDTLAKKASYRWGLRSEESKRNHLKKMREGWIKWSLSGRPTWIELKAEEWLESLGVIFEKQKRIGFYIADFLIGNIVLETNGDYWHGNPNVYEVSKLDITQRKNKRRDKAKKTFLENRGYKLLVLWEFDMKHDPDRCLLDLSEVCDVI